MIFEKLKSRWERLPEDIRQIFISLCVSLLLMCGSLLVLSSYLGQIKESGEDTPVMADTDTSPATETGETDQTLTYSTTVLIFLQE